MPLNDNSAYIVEDLPFGPILENKFREQALSRKKKAGRKIRLALEKIINVRAKKQAGPRSAGLAAWDIFVRPRLAFDLKCPDCGWSFTVDYYQGGFDEQNQMPCPKCGVKAGLAAGPVLETLKTRLLEAQADIKEGGRIIAHAVLLLEPVAPAYVCWRLMSSGIGHYLLHHAILIGRLSQAIGPDFLLIFARPKPERTCNSYIIEQWARHSRCLLLDAAEEASDLLSKLNGHRDYNPAVDLVPRSWILRRSADMTVITAAKDEPPWPYHARHLFDLAVLSENWMADPDDCVSHVAPLFSFNADEHRRAADWREKHGLPETYAAFLSRDSAYNEIVHPQDKVTELHRYRNVDVATYIPAMKWLADQGVGSLRMGKVTCQPLETDRPEIFDYASSPDHSDFLDIYFFAENVFTVGCGSGPDAMPKLMNKPFLYANSIPMFAGLMSYNFTNCIASFKPLWSKNDNRVLSFREVLAKGLDLAVRSEDYQKHSLEPLAHTPEEMLAMVQEMHARFISKTWVETDEEKVMQEKFKKLIAEFYPGFEVKTRLAFSYYSANPHFLADV